MLALVVSSFSSQHQLTIIYHPIILQVAMKFIVAVLAVAANASFLEQDPCAGCDTALAQNYQKCAMQHGNPCAETNAAGIVGSGPGQKKDVGCCLKKEKHDRCLDR